MALELRLAVTAYMELARHLNVLIENQQKALKTQVNIGLDVYCETVIEDCSRIFVDIGAGVSVEFTIDEARAFVDSRIEELSKLV
jgi:prefoldin alpha subunit